MVQYNFQNIRTSEMRYYGPEYICWSKIISQIYELRKMHFNCPSVHMMVQNYLPIIHTSGSHGYCPSIHTLVQNHFPNMHMSEIYFTAPIHTTVHNHCRCKYTRSTLNHSLESICQVSYTSSKVCFTWCFI